MTRPSIRQIVAAMWANRPTPPEILLSTILTLAGHWATDVPLVLLGTLVGVSFVLGTLYMALAELRKTASIAAGPGEEGGHDAD